MWANLLAAAIVALLQEFSGELIFRVAPFSFPDSARTFVWTLSIMAGAVWTLGAVREVLTLSRYLFVAGHCDGGRKINVGRVYECEAGN